MKILFKALCILFLLSSSLIGTGQEDYFPPLQGSEWEMTSPSELGWCTEHIDSLLKFLEDHRTKAFIILKNGKIVVEAYFNGHDKDKFWYWASAGKTLTSILIGIAQQEGKLDINDRTSKYLDTGWTSLAVEEEDLITIRHQLTMTTGLEDKGLDPYCTLPDCLIKRAAPGMRWAYHNAPYTLLDGVIENATGLSLNDYINQKLKAPTGMNGFFIKSGYNNVYTSNARSMARFGLLVDNDGIWNNTPVLTSAYINEMRRPSQDLNPAYGYLWWLNGQDKYLVPGLPFPFNGAISPSAPSDLYAGLGKDGQFLDIVPSQDLVVIRMGENPDNSLVPILFHDEMWEHINKVICLPTSSKEVHSETFKIYPNPGQNHINIPNLKANAPIWLISSSGQIMGINSKNGNIDISVLKCGTYFIKYLDKKGYYQYQVFVKTK